MLKFSMILSALGLLSAPALADPAVKAISFSRGGIDYVATDGVVAGKRVIAGYEVVTGRPFRLVVSGKRVTGTYAGSPMSFRVPAPSSAVEVASR